MARTSSITTETVAEVAEAFLAEGLTLDEITNKLVLAKIGSGSMATLSPLLRKWKEAQAEREELADVPVPEGVTRHADELMARLWREAVELATEGHAAMRRDMVAQREDATKAQDETLGDLKDVEDARDQALDDLAIAVEGKAQAAARVIELEREGAALVERIAAKDAEASTARDAASSAQDREKAMRGERDAALAKIDTATAETAKVRADLSAELSEARKTIESRTEKLEQTQSDLSSARSDLSTERAQHEATRSKLSDVTARAGQDAEAAKAAIAEVRSERDTIRQELSDCRDQRDTARAERDAAMRKVADMTSATIPATA
jgi:chromosome segregation ATPase